MMVTPVPWESLERMSPFVEAQVRILATAGRMEAGVLEAVLPEELPDELPELLSESRSPRM